MCSCVLLKAAQCCPLLALERNVSNDRLILGSNVATSCGYRLGENRKVPRLIKDKEDKGQSDSDTEIRESTCNANNV